jgi:hypothetical protein
MTDGCVVSIVVVCRMLGVCLLDGIDGRPAIGVDQWV